VAAIFFTSVLPKVIAQRNFQQHLSTPEIIAKSLPPALLWRFQLTRSWLKKKTLCSATLVLETSVLYDYFPNFIAQLRSALHENR
jgi:hypothetical protein